MTLNGAVWTVVLCILFGANAVAIKFSLVGLGEFTSAGIRFFAAALVLFAWAKIRHVPLRLKTGQFRQMSILSVTFAVQLSCFYQGLSRTTASHGVLISNILPFVVLVQAHFFIPGDRITTRKAAGILLGFIGVMFLFMDEPGLSSEIRKGDLIVLAAILIWSSNSIFIKRISDGYHPVQITFFPMAMSVPLFFAGGFLWDSPMVSTITPSVIKAMLYQSFVTASFGFLGWNSLLKKYGASALFSFVFIMPLAGVFFSVLLLDETVTPYLAASIVFIATGVLIVNLKRKKASLPLV